jgi:hypothetical protein
MYDNFAATVTRARLHDGRSEALNCAIIRNDGRRDHRRTHAPRPQAEARHGNGTPHSWTGDAAPRHGDAAHLDAARRPTAAIKKKRF